MALFLSKVGNFGSKIGAFEFWQTLVTWVTLTHTREKRQRKMSTIKMFSKNYTEISEIRLKTKNTCWIDTKDIASEHSHIDLCKFSPGNVIIVAISSWRQWLKNTWQGKTNPLNLSPGFSKCPHVGYQTSRFFTRILMKLLNFWNL